MTQIWVFSKSLPVSTFSPKGDTVTIVSWTNFLWGCGCTKPCKSSQQNFYLQVSDHYWSLPLPGLFLLSTFLLQGPILFLVRDDSRSHYFSSLGHLAPYGPIICGPTLSSQITWSNWVSCVPFLFACLCLFSWTSSDVPVPLGMVHCFARLLKELLICFLIPIPMIGFLLHTDCFSLCLQSGFYSLHASQDIHCWTSRI